MGKMIRVNTWNILKEKQTKLDKLIAAKNPLDLKWVSCFNAERLKLALLVEVGEFANEIKSFKAWAKKPEIDWEKAKEELIDCLGYFLGLVVIYQIDISRGSLLTDEREDFPFNKLLLDFFAKTNDLYVEEKEEIYKLQSGKISEKGQKTYHDWWLVFENVCWKLRINENELMEVYLAKNKINQQRAMEK